MTALHLFDLDDETSMQCCQSRQCSIVFIVSVLVTLQAGMAWRGKGQSQGSRARNMGFQGKDGTIAWSRWCKMGASVVRSLIFYMFQSLWRLNRLLLHDAGWCWIWLWALGKNHANACNALLHHLPFSLHQSGQRCLFITFGSYMERSRVEYLE